MKDELKEEEKKDKQIGHPTNLLTTERLIATAEMAGQCGRVRAEGGALMRGRSGNLPI